MLLQTKWKIQLVLKGLNKKHSSWIFNLVFFFVCFFFCFYPQILDTLSKSRNPDLELEVVETQEGDITAFHQKNVAASRKKVLPLIKTFIQK